MKRYAKLWATLLFFPVTLGVFFAGVALSDKIGEATHSGMLGICGPYGPHAGLVGCIFLGSFPAAIAAGIFSARFFYRRVSNEHKA